MKNRVSPVTELANESGVTCLSTCLLCAALTADASCCPFCCMFCGGCCGKYEPLIGIVTPLDTRPGVERLQATCTVQCAAAAIMPFTLCGCCWAGFGTCTICGKYIADCTMSNGLANQEGKPVTIQEMTRN